jgi:uncharacterized protein (UPF0264 family)
MAGLLVSVRSPREAEAALKGGAVLIDIKEPDAGSLGRASDAAIQAVLERIDDRLLVSAAMGELRDGARLFPGAGLAFVKWGLAGLGQHLGWRKCLAAAAKAMAQACSKTQPVAVAYADCQSALSPQPEDVCEFACENGWPFLLDTWTKNGSTLLDFLPVSRILSLCAECRARSVKVALAGSLGIREIETLLICAPAWFAVRTAVCRGGRRRNAIDPRRVNRLVEALRASPVAIDEN